MKKTLFIIIGIFLIISILSLFITFDNYGKYLERIISFDLDTVIEIDNDDNDINWDLLLNKDIYLNNNIVTISASGVYHLTGNIDDGYIMIGTIGNVKLILDNVNINNNSGPAIIINSASKVVIELKEGSNNYLTDGLEYDNPLYDGCVFSKSDLVFQGNGTLNVTSNYNDGIVCNDDLKINGGKYIINSYDDAIRGNDSVYVINGDFIINSNGDGFRTTNILESNKGFIYIKNGNFNINSYGDGFDSSNALIIENGDFNIKTISKKGDNQSKKGLKSTGNMIINNGKFVVDTYDDAINTNSDMFIENGNFKIKSSDDALTAGEDIIIKYCDLFIENAYEGIEASNITIMNGNYNIIARDDGINVKKNDDDEKTRDQLMVVGDLLIENGSFVIETESDGIDVNGNITINGGTILIDSASNMSENAVDYNGYCNINGGILIGVSGHNLLAQGASDTSSQYSMMYYLTEGYSPSEFVIVDNDNKEVFRYKTKKEYRNILVSSKDIEKDNSYSLIINGKIVSTIETKDVFSSDYNKEKEKEILER